MKSATKGKVDQDRLDRLTAELPAPYRLMLRPVEGSARATIQDLYDAAADARLKHLPAAYASEDLLQQDVVLLFNANFRNHGILHSVPNGGDRDPITARNMKLTGVVKGTPDLTLLVADNRTIRIELKNGHHKLDPYQVLWHHKAMTLGHETYIFGTIREIAAFFGFLFQVSLSSIHLPKTP